MYKIFADDVLIYDSTVDDYKIGKGIGALETNKAGSFTFSVYPDHFYYDRFVKKKTVIIVTKSDRILFRGRVLDDQDDMWKRREIVCEGELNFLQDSLIRPYTFTGTPEEAFRKYITEHNAQVDEFKRFKIGQVTVHDPNNYIARSNSNYENALKNLTSRLLEDSLGGYFHITHGDDGKDPIPTLHYLADFTEISSQVIEFGSNLKDYLKKGSGQTIATAIIPLGVRLDDNNIGTDDLRLTIAEVNNGLDYVYDEAAVEKHGWIFDTVIYDDVTLPANLKKKGLAELAKRIRESITLELTAVDLHLLNRSIESFRHDTYVRVISPPHNFAETLLCRRQTFNILRPDNDTVTLGTPNSSLTGAVLNASSASAAVTDIKRDVVHLNQKTGAYKIAEQQLTSLLAQSFGVFKTEEVLPDGSTVHYMHDKPTLSASTNIWKMTGDAFAVSSDGGETWNAGLDASGNAILNVLSVIGINASWINADDLSAVAAKIAGWNIDDTGIWWVGKDPDNPEFSYKIIIAPPLKDWSILANPFIETQISSDGGNTWRKVQGIGVNGGYSVGDQTDLGIANIIGGSVSLALGSDKFLDLRVREDHPAAFTEINQSGAYVWNKDPFTHSDAVNKGGLYIDNSGESWCFADNVAAIKGYTGTITLGGIAMTFYGGVLTYAGYG